MGTRQFKYCNARAKNDAHDPSGTSSEGSKVMVSTTEVASSQKKTKVASLLISILAFWHRAISSGNYLQRLLLDTFLC